MVYLSLFIVSFLAATILPASSELTLAGLLNTRNYNELALLFTASFGNILGSIFNWLLGFYLLKNIKKNGFLLAKIKLAKPHICSKDLEYGPCCLLGHQF